MRLAAAERKIGVGGVTGNLCFFVFFSAAGRMSDEGGTLPYLATEKVER